MNENFIYKKLDQDDILEILVEHFQDGELSDCSRAQGCLLGTPGKDLRFIGVFSNDESITLHHDYEKLDEALDFNGDHSFINAHPEFQLRPPQKLEKNT